MVSRWRNSLAGSRRNIHHHYDIGNDFYRLWLDEEMVYTCAYFARPEMTLEQAQRAKMDHVAHKVQLKPGQQVIEAGCGWGSLAIHLAKHHGVSVRAYNISAEQVDYARKRAEAEGLTDRVSFIQDDYRNISGQCDAFVSVGMLEHVGQENYEALGAAIHRVLKPNGRGLIHTIGRNRSRSLSKWIHQRIFPGADPPTMAEMMRIFEPYDMSLLDAENLRLHYAQTLRHWLERFEANADQVEKMFGPRFVRTWRMYLSGSVAGFTVGGLQLFQVAFARGSDNTVPRTREHMYRPGVFPHDPTVEGTLSFADAGPDLPRSSSEPTQQDQPAQQQAAQGQPA
jgi:cyclopropane-fatty-acyl-phospholipid synthase